MFFNLTIAEILQISVFCLSSNLHYPRIIFAYQILSPNKKNSCAMRSLVLSINQCYELNLKQIEVYSK